RDRYRHQYPNNGRGNQGRECASRHSRSQRSRGGSSGSSRKSQELFQREACPHPSTDYSFRRLAIPCSVKITFVDNEGSSTDGCGDVLGTIEGQRLGDGRGGGAERVRGHGIPPWKGAEEVR